MAAQSSKLSIATSTILVLALFETAHAQIATDGTVGPRVELGGPEFAIPADLGRQAGRNLFHSFERFSLATGERATFSGPNRIDNVISRVTGGERSDIDGTLRSTIPGADFYFINPAGILFGPNASLDLQGSFHVSTADEVRFRDGAKFSADLGTRSSFAVAAPEAFGFLSDSPASIVVDQSGLSAPGSVSLVGGNLDIGGAGVGADHTVTLVSFGGPGAASVSSGEVVGDISGTIRITDESFIGGGRPEPGTIRIKGGRIVIEERSNIFLVNFSVDSDGGLVAIVADDVLIDRGFIATATTGNGAGGEIVIDARRTLTITGREFVDDDGSRRIELSEITSSSGPSFPNASRDAGAVTLTAENIVIGAGAFIESNTFTRGDGGSVTLEASDTLMLGGFVSTSTFDEGAGGQVSLRADTLHVAGGAASADSIGGGSGDPGPSGDLLIAAGTLIMETGSLTTGAEDVGAGPGGQGGRIVVEATELIDLFRAVILSNGALPAEGDSIITLTAPLIAINKSLVTSLTGGVPIEGSGEARVLGDATVISADSEVAASSTVEIRGQETDLGSQLISLDGTLVEIAPLRERCSVRRDVGASSFTNVGRGGLPASPNAPLRSTYRSASFGTSADAGSESAATFAGTRGAMLHHTGCAGIL